MFRLTRPTAAEINASIAAAERLPQQAAHFLSVEQGFKRSPPLFCAHDYAQSRLGIGGAAFAAARRAFMQWRMFDLGWVRVANAAAQIAPGQFVAVEARTLGLWTLNLSQIVEIVDEPTRFGFVYVTTPLHVEDGEERFLLEFDPDSGDVKYVLEAISRPRNALARLGFPMTRAFQHRFARDSQRGMRALAAGESGGKSTTHSHVW